MNKLEKTKKDISFISQLMNSVEKRQSFIKTIQINPSSCNYIIENCYEVIRELIEARMLIDGYKSNSHSSTLNFMNEMNLSDADIKFTNDLFKIVYDIKHNAKDAHVEYCLLVLNFLDYFSEKLKARIKKRLIEF